MDKGKLHDECVKQLGERSLKPQRHVQCRYDRWNQAENNGDTQKLQNYNQGTSRIVTEGIETQHFRGAIQRLFFSAGIKIWHKPNCVTIKSRYQDHRPRNILKGIARKRLRQIA